jgi:hypothetical protein
MEWGGRREDQNRTHLSAFPIRDFDWSAVTDDYDEGSPIGFGRTEREAITDLMTRIEEA